MTKFMTWPIIWCVYRS